MILSHYIKPNTPLLNIKISKKRQIEFSTDAIAVPTKLYIFQ